MGAVSVLPPFGDLFKSTKVEVVQSVVASEQLEDLIRWIVAEVDAVSETQKNCSCKDLLEKVDQLMDENNRASSEVLILREAQETYQGQIRELDERACSLQGRLEVLERLPQRLAAHIEEQAARNAELAAQSISNSSAHGAQAEGSLQPIASEAIHASAMGPRQHQESNEAGPANGGSAVLNSSEEQQTGTALQSTKETHRLQDEEEPNKPHTSYLGDTEKEFGKLQDAWTHQQEELLDIKSQVDLLQHSMSYKTSYADLQALLPSLLPQLPVEAAQSREGSAQGQETAQEKELLRPSPSDVQVTLLHQRLSTKADAVVVQDLREQMLNMNKSMHGIEEDCQKQLGLVRGELELVRTASLLPLPAIAPSSLILDIMRAAEGAAEQQPPTPQQQASVTALSDLSGGLAEAASTAVGQLDTSAVQREQYTTGSSQDGGNPPSSGQELSTGTADANYLALELESQRAGMASDQAAASRKQAAISKSAQEEGVHPERAVAQIRDASVLAALHVLEHRVAALHQHLSRVQRESTSDRLQLGRLAKDVQTCLEGGVLKAARLPANNLPCLPANNMPIGELSTLDKVAAAVSADSANSKGLIGTATLKEAHNHAELSELRSALETITAVTGLIVLSRQEAHVRQGGMDGARGGNTSMEATLAALERAMDTQQVNRRDPEDHFLYPRNLVASNAAGAEYTDEQLLSISSDVATLKHIVLDLTHAQKGLTNAADLRQVILARKPIPSYRCMSCNRPVADVEALPRSSLPAKQNSSTDATLCKGMQRESHAARVRPRTAASGKFPSSAYSKGTGAVSLRGSPSSRRERVDPVDWGPKLPPGGWKAIVGSDEDALISRKS